MLVDNDVYINKYVADGSTTEFPIAFPFLEASHIEVYTRGEDGEDILVDPSMYTITGAGVETGGELTFNTTPVAGTVIAIIRNVPITQLYAYTELDNFPAESHENALAKLTMIDQQQAEILGRALTLPVTSAKTPDQWISDFTNTMEQAVDTAQTAATTAVDSAQTATGAVAQINVTLSDITSAKNDALGAISAGETEALSTINTAKTTAVGIVSGEGDTQIARLQNYATGVITEATSLYKIVTITLDSNIASGTTIITPLVNGSALTYWVGKDMLGLSYNGVELYKDLQYQEVGNQDTVSYQVKMLMPMYTGDQLCFKIMSAVVDSVVADPLQPDGTTIQLDANGKLSTVLTDQAITQAIGYTAANDSNVVKLSGNQNITGVKTWTTQSTGPRSTNTSKTLTVDMRVSDTPNGGIFDVTNQNWVIGRSGATGGFFIQTKSGSSSAIMEGNPNGTLTWGGKGFVYDSGNQTIAGTKTFSADVPIKLTANEAFIRKELNGQPSSQRTIGVSLFDTQGNNNKSWTEWWWTSTNTACQHGIRNIYSDTVAYYALRTHSSSVNYLEPVNSTIWLGRNTSGYKWEGIYLNASAINTSDERLKDNITIIPDAVLDAWGDVQWSQYQFKDSIAEKGANNARLHTGTIAQRIRDIFEAHGIDASRYGLWCYDHWDAEPEECDDKGNVITPAREASDAYALRYEEALCMEAAYQRRRADRAEARISALEQRMDELENVLITLGGHNND